MDKNTTKEIYEDLIYKIGRAVDKKISRVNAGILKSSSGRSIYGQDVALEGNIIILHNDSWIPAPIDNAEYQDSTVYLFEYTQTNNVQSDQPVKFQEKGYQLLDLYVGDELATPKDLVVGASYIVVISKDQDNNTKAKILTEEDIIPQEEVGNILEEVMNNG